MKTRATLTTVFVLSRTIFLHLWISVTVFFIVTGFFITQNILTKKYIQWSKIRLSTLLFLAVSISVRIHLYGTDPKEPAPQQPTFIGTGEVIDLQRNGKYTIETLSGKYLLKVSNSPKYSNQQDANNALELGDIIRTVGKITRAKQQSVSTGISLSSIQLPTLFIGGFDYAQWLQMKGFRGDIQGSSVIVLGSHKPLPWVLAFRKAILMRIKLSLGTNRASGLLQGMLIGDRSGIPEEEYQQFISSGLVHIVAVSGSNILYVILLFHTLLFFIPYYSRICIIVILIIFYALICGLDSSVIRAVIMGGLALISLLGGRIISPRRLLSIAWVSMLLRNPWLLLFDLGFLLSFSALAGILMINELTSHWTNENFLKKILKGYFLPSLGAGRGALPVLLFFTGTTNLLSIVGNIFIVPFVPIVLCRGVIVVFIDSAFPITNYIDIAIFPFERLYWLARRLSNNGLYLSTSVWRTRHVFTSVVLGISFIFFKIASKMKQDIIE